MIGHAAANLIPVIASNRVGIETYGNHSMTFYGTSFMSNHQGVILQQMDRTSTGIIQQSFDLKAIEKMRYSWGIFRDRRPAMYQRLLKK
jgi:N-carbamoylputrescine amidase